MRKKSISKVAFLSLGVWLLTNTTGAHACIREEYRDVFSAGSFRMRDDSHPIPLFGGEVIASGSDSKVGIRPWLTLHNKDSADCTNRIYKIEERNVPAGFKIITTVAMPEIKPGGIDFAEFRVYPPADAETGKHPMSIRVSSEDPSLDLKFQDNLFVNKDVTNMSESISPSLGSPISRDSRLKVEYATNLTVASIQITASDVRTQTSIGHAFCNGTKSCSFSIARADIPLEQMAVSVSLQDNVQGIYHRYVMVHDVQSDSSSVDGGSTGNKNNSPGKSKR